MAKKSTKDKNKSENVSMKVRGIDFVPLLLGHAHVGKATNAQQKLLIEELCVRGIVFDAKENIVKINPMSITQEHSNATMMEMKKHVQKH